MKRWFWIGAVAFLPIPWFFVLLLRLHVLPVPQVLLSGLAIVGAAFLLSWMAEVAQYEIPRSLAVAFVAMVAILPEYAVDIYVAAKAGRNPAYIPYAVANMTGANRLIIGVAWAMVVFLWWLRSQKKKITVPLSREKARKWGGATGVVKIEEGHGFEFALLFLVTLYSFIIPMKGTLSIFDGVVLFAFFLFYIWRSAKGGVEEPELEGVAASIAVLSRPVRRLTIALIFAFAFLAIAFAARPFTEGLIATGRIFHIEEFMLIQIFAPLASEAPEFIVAGMLAFRGNPSLGIGTLLSSKLNQWTLLVGMIPLVYTISGLTGGHLAFSFPLNGRQVDEMILTSAQSFFAVSIMADFSLSLLDGTVLFLLYFTQYFFPSPHSRFLYSFIYLFLGVLIFLFKKAHRLGLKTHFKKLRNPD